MSLDLDRYFERVGAGPVETDLSGLARLHAAHLAAIPFENIDVWLGRDIQLDLDSLERKLVRGRRGGYCFEHNTLFAAVLRQVGFEVSTLEARVRPPGATEPLPRTHMVLVVTIAGRRWLADVGFGGDGPLEPVTIDGEESEQADAAYRVEEELDAVSVLRRCSREGWRDLYAFSTRPALPIDFEVANHYTSTHPSSVFRRTLTVQRSDGEGRRILRGRSYTLRRGSEEERREIAPNELGDLLTRDFGLGLRTSEAIALEALV
ncbi:MAG: arylamine N-acetyltransferase [Thermoanaerobaculia bacterium]|nr:arylamine N-acetyltransferase [Thermoanaerobaculia bacterium]